MGSLIFCLGSKTNIALEGAKVVGSRVQPSTGGTPTVVDPAVQAVWDKKDIKAQRVILEAVKDHLIPLVSETASSKEMYDALVSLFQSDNMS
jgi:hypothetical protein